MQLAKQFNFDYETGSDVECIFHLYQTQGIDECVKNLDGVFAFCILDPSKKRICIARDPYGVRPLFRLFGNSGVLAVSSEAKGTRYLYVNKKKGKDNVYIVLFFAEL